MVFILFNFVPLSADIWKASKEFLLSSVRATSSVIRMMSICCWPLPNIRYHMSKSLDKRPLVKLDVRDFGGHLDVTQRAR